MVVYSSIAVAMTAPGQTAAVSVFIDPMISDLGISRTAVSTAYLVGTLTGAAAMPMVGRVIDRIGVRKTLVVLGALFGAVLIAMSFASEVFGLTAGFVGIRMVGQGALGLAATTITARWFRRRRGTALGLVSGAGAGFISISPVLLERLIATEGWQAMWVYEGIAVWVVVIPIAVFGVRNHPHDVGQFVDGDPRSAEAHGPEIGVTRGQAMRTPFFWVLCAAVAAAGMLGTAVAFHQISLLTEHGLTPVEAAANFVPQTLAGIVATLLTGYVMDRLAPKGLIIASMTGLAAGLAWATVVGPGWSALGFGVVMGAAGNAIRTIEAAMTPRLFGTKHLGAIRGVVTLVSVASTALGPVWLAWPHELSGSYTPALLVSIAIPTAIIVATVVTRIPATVPAR